MSMVCLDYYAGLNEPKFSLTDGFVITLRRKPNRAFEAVGGQMPKSSHSQPESRPESQPESQPESLKARILRMLANAPLGKAELSGKLGQKEVSGQLNKVIRDLLDESSIEMTLPRKPNSRLQKYRLTKKGKGHLKSQGKR